MEAECERRSGAAKARPLRSAAVKVFGRRPHDDGATFSGGPHPPRSGAEGLADADLDHAGCVFADVVRPMLTPILTPRTSRR